ncbi:nucleotidyl transferase AbiEii/AbiGii toxin family protein [Cupriavidus sp. UME77]|uniref:nucleotidyl transferase AbiEii/AbiGii toxin family protein n=1 Tax=Cupriavidus sp. UME77 TaxID=1862321 RepID=UPI001602E99B|nr:nucleotidyl transferase AbiEii/AbiGii toxin family protein [Cupriavidus sp. UME77]MBB1631947.1 hypothetical protein [Cupriavidus sp. UME77]
MYLINSDRPLDPTTVAILRTVDGVTKARGLTYFVVGATARDILLTHVHGLRATRATKDVDFALAVESWTHFDEIRDELSRIAGFRVSDDIQHRLYYQVADQPPYPLDLVPFGGVATPEHLVGWPPDMKMLMNVAGYPEVAEAAEQVEVAEGLVVNVASLSGLALLKLFAWQDRWEESTKDADDLLTLMRAYTDAGNFDRIFELADDVLTELGYDTDDAGALLLGKDIATLARPDTYAQCIRILETPELLDRLSIHMARTRANVDEAMELATRTLKLFRRGLNSPDKMPG